MGFNRGQSNTIHIQFKLNLISSGARIEMKLSNACHVGPNGVQWKSREVFESYKIAQKLAHHFNTGCS